MKKIKVLFLTAVIGLIAFNGVIVSLDNFSPKFDLSVLSHIAIASAEDGVAGDGIKNVVVNECECTDGKTGHTLDCEDVASTGEVCTADPLTKCYKIEITLIPLGANAVICD